MGTFTNHIFGKTKGSIVEFHNVADLIPDLDTFQSLISGANVSSFRISGNNAIAIVDGEFSLTTTLLSDSNVTVFKDSKNYCNEVGEDFFKNCSSLTLFESYNVSYFGDEAMRYCTALSELRSEAFEVVLGFSAMADMSICRFSMNLKSLGKAFEFLNSYLYSFLNVTFSNNAVIQHTTFRNTKAHSEYPSINLPQIDFAGRNCFLGSEGLVNVVLDNVTTVREKSFQDMHTIQSISMANLTTVVYTFSPATWADNPMLTTLYIPKFKKTTDQNVNLGLFRSINPNATITVSPEMFTSNNGYPDVDIQYAIDRGCTIVYDRLLITPNIVINNVADIVTNSSILESILDGATTNTFQIIDNNVYANVSGNFVLSTQILRGSSVTLFTDLDGLCTEVSNSYFSTCHDLRVFRSDNVSVFRTGSFFNCNKLESILSNHYGVIIEANAFRGCSVSVFDLSIANVGGASFLQCYNFSFENISFTNNVSFPYRSFRQIKNGGTPSEVNISEVTAFGGQSLLGAININSFIFNNCLTFSSSATFASTTASLIRLPEAEMVYDVFISAFSNNSNLLELYIPKVKKEQETGIVTQLFQNINPACTITVSNYMATSNNGGEDADIAYARSRGCTIIFATT